MERSERKAIENCQKGELESFSYLYDKYIEKIYKFIYYKTHHKETAEDLVSVSFHKALKSIKKYDFNQGSFSSWLYRIARNMIIDHYRTKKEYKNIEDAWDLSEEKNQEDDLDLKLKLEKAKEYLKNLKKEQREIIIMRLWDGLSYGEIAKITKKSEASLKMNFSRTIKKIRKEMPVELLIFLILNIGV
jgi:RNA polymerase sigma-70 factor (ECF subfamily)